MLVEQFICGSDNIALLLHDEESNNTIAIDAPDGDAILAALKKNNRQLAAVLITHHHQDHTIGIKQLKEATEAKIYGPGRAIKQAAGVTEVNTQTEISGLDYELTEHQQFTIGKFIFKVIATPGHTMDEISYYMSNEKKVFTGDTMFSLGCGRIFEGSVHMMYNSLQKIAQLPAETEMYCGHEYSQANARFALSVEPSNKALKQRADEINSLRQAGKITLPSTLNQELATNPFLRCSSTEIRQNLHCTQQSDNEQVFAKLRQNKDNF